MLCIEYAAKYVVGRMLGVGWRMKFECVDQRERNAKKRRSLSLSLPVTH